jgi:hypothetical protein
VSAADKAAREAAALAALIEAARTFETAAVTVEAAGALLDVSGSYVGHLEAGRAPSAAVAERIARVAGVAVEAWGELARPAAGGRRRR